MKNFLITGITGFAGPHLANLLHREGHKVHGLIRRTNGMEADILDVVSDEVYNSISFHHSDLGNYRVLRNIFENNYDYPTAVILIKDNKWRWIMSSSGNHRAHIKKELTYDYINCKVSGVVNFSKLHRLKNVVNGIFNEKEAAAIFDNVFKGEVPVRGPI